MPFETVVRKTIEYLAMPSVVGYEDFFLSKLKEDFENLGIEVIAHDDLLEVRGKKPNSAIITAHTDRHGLISLGNGQYAYAAQHVKESKYGEPNRHSKSELESIKQRFINEYVFAYDPTSGEKRTCGKIEACAASQKDGTSMFTLDSSSTVKKNVPIAYARTAERKGQYLKGQIDNTVSLGVIYVLFQNGFQGTALLTTEEEIGYSWHHLVHWLKSHAIETQNLIVLDTSPYNDADPVKEGQVTLRTRDKSASFNESLVYQIQERSRHLDIPTQIKDKKMLASGLPIDKLGSTELGKLILNSNQRWSGATVQIPTLSYHTSYETTSQDCVESYYALLQNILIEDPVF